MARVTYLSVDGFEEDMFSFRKILVYLCKIIKKNHTHCKTSNPNVGEKVWMFGIDQEAPEAVPAQLLVRGKMELRMNKSFVTILYS